MEQFKKFIDVYNKKIAAMKGGNETGGEVEDLEEVGDVTTKLSPKINSGKSIKKGNTESMHNNSYVTPDQEATVDPIISSPMPRRKGSTVERSHNNLPGAATIITSDSMGDFGRQPQPNEDEFEGSRV